MPKLYFKYGTMNSSKTSNLMMISHNYVSRGRRVITVKPEVDTRDGVKNITSRVIGSIEADVLLSPEVDEIILDGSVSCVLVDEAQFLSRENVLALRALTVNVPVIAFGLRTDFMGSLFEGSKALFELADSIEEIKTICEYCDKKAIINAKYRERGGECEIIVSGDQVELGSEELYKPLCWLCWNDKLMSQGNIGYRRQKFLRVK